MPHCDRTSFPSLLGNREIDLALRCYRCSDKRTAEAAAAQVELLRIRRLRENIGRAGLEELRRLVALDRYECMAQTKRRRAARKL